VVGRVAYINKTQGPFVLSGSTEGNRIFGTCMDVKIKKQAVGMWSGFKVVQNWFQ
jgi:hypothetical protein